MKEWFRKMTDLYYKPIYRIMVFVAAVLVMVLSFPNTNKMSYEYELNRPWRYDNIIAPFDFPIYKSDKEIAVERDSILNNFRPYYTMDSVDMSAIRSSVVRMLDACEGKMSLLCPTLSSVDSVKLYLQASLINALNGVYKRGVLEIPQDYDVLTGEYELMVIKGNVLEPYFMSELLTMAQAYSQVVGSVEHDLYQKYGQGATWTEVLVSRLPISDMVTTNVKYDEERTMSERDIQLSSMALTSGKGLLGQKIISRGDIVDANSMRLIDSLNREYEARYGMMSPGLPLYIAQMLVLLCLMSTLFLFLKYFRKDVFEDMSSVNFIVIMMTIYVVGASLVAGRHGNISFLLPFVSLPIIMRIFFDSRLAMYVHVITILIISSLAHDSRLFIMLHIPAGMVAIISLINMTRRGQIVRTAVLVFVMYSLVYIGYNVWHPENGVFANGLSEGVMPVEVKFAVNALFMLLSYPLIYIFEKLFGFISDVTLIELSDSNNELLRQLAEKAPGTFQHSVQVGNLGQEVAVRIGANGMMVRAGAMYHDIGKIVAPMYFTENQAGGMNPHDGMPYEESAKMIISHVDNGLKLASKFNIPQQIRDVIRVHHGQTQARYFYVSWCNEHQGEEPDMSKFTYPGPVPQTKEQAIVMMADAVEASSRSLKQYTDESIDALVEKIINQQVEEKQFREAPITFKDIEVAKQVFKEKLRNVYHARIQYPELLK